MSWPNLPPTASFVETIWTALSAAGTAIAALGSGITTTNLGAARRAHRRALTTVPANPLHIAITGQAVRNEILSVAALSLLLFVLALFTAIGIVAMAMPEPVRDDVRPEIVAVTLVLVLGAALLTVSTVLLTIGSVLNRRDRHQMTNRIAGRILAEQLRKRLSGSPPESTP